MDEMLSFSFRLWIIHQLFCNSVIVPFHFILVRMFVFSFQRSQKIQSHILFRSLGTSTHANNELRHSVTMKWVNSIVINEKLCPFAAPVVKDPKLRIKVSNAVNDDEMIRDLKYEVKLLVGDQAPLQQSQQHETTLVVLDDPSLKDFRDLVRLSWRAQEEAVNEPGYTGDLQLVLFHPEAAHNTYAEKIDDAADYTIRSPYPIIHLLREVDVMRAVTSAYSDLEGLPSRNKARFREQGVGTCAARLNACHKL